MSPNDIEFYSKEEILNGPDFDNIDAFIVKKLPNESNIDYFKRCCDIIKYEKCKDKKIINDILTCISVFNGLVILNNYPNINEFQKIYKDLIKSNGFKNSINLLNKEDKFLVTADPFELALCILSNDKKGMIKLNY